VKQAPLSAWLTVVVAAAAFMVLVLLASRLLGAIVGPRAQSLRQQVTLRITRSALGQAAGIVLLALYLHVQGHSLAELGFSTIGTPLGWLVSGAVTAFFVFGLLRGPLRGVAKMRDLSAFRLYNALAAAVAGGFIEETLFRGFVMTELAGAGVGWVLQVAAGAVLWGLVHFQWGRARGHYDSRRVIGAVGNTGVLGLAYGVAYLVGGRSLWPVIAGHGVLNLFVEPWLVMAGLTGRLGSSAAAAQPINGSAN